MAIIVTNMAEMIVMTIITVEMIVLEEMIVMEEMTVTVAVIWAMAAAVISAAVAVVAWIMNITKKVFIIYNMLFIIKIDKSIRNKKTNDK